MEAMACVRGWLIAAILLLGLPVLRGDDAADAPPAAVTAPITDPMQVGEHFREVLSRSQFQEIAEPPVNTRIQDWLSQWFRSLGARFGEFKYANRMPAFESLLMTLLVSFAIAVLLYIMVRLTRRRGRMELEPNEEITGQKVFRLPEDYNQEINHAIRAGNWHAAYLASWRQFLSRLEHRSLVDADRTRTNREYLAQLREKSLPASAVGLLNGLVDAYDRFVYGRQAIAEAEWKLFREQIDETTLLLHLEEKRKSVPTGGATP